MMNVALSARWGISSPGFEQQVTSQSDATHTAEAEIVESAEAGGQK